MSRDQSHQDPTEEPYGAVGSRLAQVGPILGKGPRGITVSLATMGSTRPLSPRPVPCLQREPRMSGVCMTWSILPSFPFEGCSSLLPFLFASCRKSWLVLAVSTRRQRYLASAPKEKHQAKADELRLHGESRSDT